MCFSMPPYPPLAFSILLSPVGSPVLLKNCIETKQRFPFNMVYLAKQKMSRNGTEAYLGL